MPNYRRFLEPGAMYFFTVVTADRVPALSRTGSRSIARDVPAGGSATPRPFRVTAIVLLPDHLHMVWSLPCGDCDYSTRIAAMKAAFSRAWLDRGGTERPITKDQTRQRRRGIWQSRFLEHMIRDEDDLEAHVNYIHCNPVKHGWALRPADWRFSSFLRYVRAEITRLTGEERPNPWCFAESTRRFWNEPGYPAAALGLPRLRRPATELGRRGFGRLKPALRDWWARTGDSLGPFGTGPLAGSPETVVPTDATSRPVRTCVEKELTGAG